MSCLDDNKEVEINIQSAISNEDLDRFSADFETAPKNRLALNAVTRNGIQEAALNRQLINGINHTFSDWIETSRVTNQKASGRCWLFAGLNVLRLAAMEKMDLEHLELSQTYLMFWDKLEKANYFLENIIETCDQPLDGRLVAWILSDPLPDGGQWNMFVNLVRKYGVVPKFVMPETHSSSISRPMNALLAAKLREGAQTLREMHQRGCSGVELRQAKSEMMNIFYRMLTIHLGKPATSFLWEWRDQDKQFHRHKKNGGILTPQEFFAKYVDFDLDSMVCLIDAPTQDKPYKHLYTVQYLGNVVGGQDVRYLNVDMATLKQAAVDMIVENRTVWFGCDVSKMMNRDLGILDQDVYELELVYGTPFLQDKAGRLDFGHSRMTHAMVLTGVGFNTQGKPAKWRVENSWGAEVGDKGSMIMSDQWFEEYLYEVTVNKQYLSAELLAVLDTEATILPPWDPMGALAKAA